MTISDENLQRRLEIRDKIEHLEEQMCIYPAVRKQAQRHIKELRRELEQLQAEHEQQTLNLGLN